MRPPFGDEGVSFPDAVEILRVTRCRPVLTRAIATAVDGGLVFVLLEPEGTRRLVRC